MKGLITYTVYALACPKTKNVKYIGYTKHPLHVRLKGHYNDLRRGVKTYKTHWLATLTEPALIFPIEEGIPTIELTIEKEIKWISSYTNLTNSTTGGEISKAYRPEVRKKMSEIQKSKGWFGQKNPMYGKERKDLSKRNKNKVWSNEVIEMKSSKMTSKYNTPDYKALFIETQKTRKQVSQFTMSGELVKTFPSTSAVKKDGFGSKEVQRCCIGKHSQHKGFKWAYHETDV